MHLGGLLSTQEARVARGDSYASFVLSNLLRASITPWLHAARLPFLNSINIESITPANPQQIVITGADRNQPKSIFDISLR